MTITLTRSQASFDREIQVKRDDYNLKINTAVGKKRGKYITPIPGQEMIYKDKEEEAKLYVAESPEPATLEDYPWIEKEIGVTAPTAYELAQVWLNMAAQWRYVGPLLENLRLSSVNAISAATSKAEMDAIMSSFEANLDLF